jgi:hypothetical protein
MTRSRRSAPLAPKTLERNRKHGKNTIKKSLEANRNISKTKQLFRAIAIATAMRFTPINQTITINQVINKRANVARALTTSWMKNFSSDSITSKGIIEPLDK